MALETATYISDLVSTNPVSSDNISQGDDHIRLLKSSLKTTFPNITGVVTPTHTQLNYVTGVTSALQTQLDAKAPSASPTLTGTITLNGTLAGTGLASPPAIGGTTPAAGSFTTLAASSTVSGTGFSTYLASPPAIGGTAAAAGSFTTLSASGDITASGTGSVKLPVGTTAQRPTPSQGMLRYNTTLAAFESYDGSNWVSISFTSLPQNSQTTGYTLVATDNGKHISITTGGVTVPASVFSVGDTVTIYNNSGSSQTITQGASATLRHAGTANTGNRTLAQYGLCSILCVASNTFVISGSGVS